MVDGKQMQFGQRLQRIDRNHQKLARGYVMSMNHDGLMIAQPRKKASSMPLRALFLCLLTLLVFKGFLYAELGAAGYADRVALLEGGNAVEKIGSYAMKADPVTLWIAGLMEPFVN